MSDCVYPQCAREARHSGTPAYEVPRAKYCNRHEPGELELVFDPMLEQEVWVCGGCEERDALRYVERIWTYSTVKENHRTAITINGDIDDVSDGDDLPGLVCRRCDRPLLVDPDLLEFPT